MAPALLQSVALSKAISYLSPSLLPNFFCMRNEESELQEVLALVALAPRVLSLPWLALQTCVHVKYCAQAFSSVAHVQRRLPRRIHRDSRWCQ